MHIDCVCVCACLCAWPLLLCVQCYRRHFIAHLPIGMLLYAKYIITPCCAQVHRYFCNVFAVALADIQITYPLQIINFRPCQKLHLVTAAPPPPPAIVAKNSSTLSQNHIFECPLQHVSITSGRSPLTTLV